MTTEKKNAISDLTESQCTAIIEFAYMKTPTLKRISQRAFRSIVGEVGHRDRPQNDSNGKPAGFWCASSLDQLATATGYSVGAVRDVLWLATEVGIVRTVRRGGQNTATKRTIDLDAMLYLLNELCAEYPQLSDEDWRGIWRNKRGLTQFHSGIESNRRGADTAHLIVVQDSFQESKQHSSRKTKPRNSSAFGNALPSQPIECEICDGTGFVSTGENRGESRARLCICRNR
jgi:hypothetical protein